MHKAESVFVMQVKVVTSARQQQNNDNMNAGVLHKSGFKEAGGPARTKKTFARHRRPILMRGYTLVCASQSSEGIVRAACEGERQEKEKRQQSEQMHR